MLKSRAANLRLMFSKKDNLLYATDSGAGFRPGAPDLPKLPAARVAHSGRLPRTSPPFPPAE